MAVNLPSEFILDLRKAHRDVRQLFDMCLGVFSTVQQTLGLLLEHLDFVLEDADLVLQVTLLQFVDVYNVVIPMLSNGASEADTTGAIFAETFYIFAWVVQAAENVVVLLTLLILLSAGAARCEATIAA